MKKIMLTFMYILSLFVTPIFFTGCEDHDSSSSDIQMVWAFGGVNGSGHIEDPNCQIQNLHINGTSGLSYQWVPEKTMAAWGESDPKDLVGLACAGYYDEETKMWRVGKFDWISSSRLTRDFHNISTHYNGWEAEKFFAAKQKCFFIISAKGNKRTNILISK